VPKGWVKPDTLYYNPYFHSINIAMPPPLAADGQVTYSDGSPATTDQYAKDVTAFLTWTAEPKLENRKETGMAVILFLIIMTGLGYLSYRKVWADIKKA
jgi:ubiquinol-cytochrome c reductase cytochrome c1 subunit